MHRALFGTDGLRGRANRYPVTPEVCLALGRALVQYLEARTDRSTPGRRHHLTIGRDTRLSGPMLECALASGIMSAGGDVTCLGVVPTPAVALAVRTLKADAGLVISASHNPYWDNGIKVFGSDSFKLSDEDEAEIEDRLSKGLGSIESSGGHADGERIGREFQHQGMADEYASWLRSSVPSDLRLDGMHIVLDCAHGAAFEVAPRVLEELGARLTVIGASPDGTNINQGCGALEPALLALCTRQDSADLGIALDGDADRVILVDEESEILDGDDILAILAAAMKGQGRLDNPVVVATIMSNLGLELALDALGIELVRTAVGDRYVIEEMRRRCSILGGESSGHIVNLERSTTGDGLLTALTVAAEMVHSGQPLSRLRQGMRHFPQRTANVAVASRMPLESLDTVQTTIRAAESALGRRGRVLVRYSGTEPKVRVMVEGDDLGQVQRWTDEIARELEGAIGQALS